MHLTWWQQVNSWISPIANGHLTLLSLNNNSLEVSIVSEDGSIWSSDGEFHLVESVNCREESLLLAAQQHSVLHDSFVYLSGQHYSKCLLF